MFFSRIDRKWWVALNISIGIYMSTLDASIVNISLPTIIHSLNTDLKAVAWVVMAYLIIATGCLLLMGRLADLYGQKRIYLFGFLTFTVGSALCGFSPTIYFLIASRMLQGLGASATTAIGLAIITATFPERDRGQAFGIVGSVVSVGFLTGPLLGLVNQVFEGLPGAVRSHRDSRWIEGLADDGNDVLSLKGSLPLRVQYGCENMGQVDIAQVVSIRLLPG